MKILSSELHIRHTFKEEGGEKILYNGSKTKNLISSKKERE